jgi:hypothetical protein
VVDDDAVTAVLPGVGEYPEPDTGERPPPGDDPFVATRRLCAGVYLDRDFRKRVLREVYNDGVSRVAPSYGFDLVPVVRHAWAAWRLEFWQHIGVLVIVCWGLIRVPLAALTAVGVLCTYHALRGLGRLLSDVGTYLTRRRGIPGESQQLKFRGQYVGLGMLGCSALLAAAGVGEGAGGEGLRRLSGVASVWPARGGFLDAAELLAAVCVLAVAVGAVRQFRLEGLHHPKALQVLDPTGRLGRIAIEQQHPFTVFAGYRPFIGAGKNIVTWSFAQRLIHAKATPDEPDRVFSKRPFRTRSLIRHLKRRIRSLETSPDPETRLPNLRVRDHLFLEGVYAHRHLGDLVSRPQGKVINSIITNPTGVARHQLACQVTSWGGEVVTTVFVHVSLQGKTLYIEFSTYALPPTRNEFHIIDEVRGNGIGAYLRSIGGELVRLPLTALATPKRLLNDAVDLGTTARARFDAANAVRRGINIGSKVSIREVAATKPDDDALSVRDPDRTYFQYRDVIKHWKVIERQLIAAVGEYLRKKGVDTGEFWERAVTILNQGVIAGTMTNINSSVGYQPQTTNTAPPAGGNAT